MFVARARGVCRRLVLGIPTAIAIVLAGSGGALAAAWSLNSGLSHLSFGSIKSGDIGEVHHFRKLSGEVDGSGKATITIDLGSVETAIDIRNERMREILFHVAEFPAAKVTASVDMAALEALKPGESTVRDMTATLSLVGESNDISTPTMVTRLSENRVMVQPLGLIILDAGAYDLANGVEKLREIAGLESISKAVPTAFTFVFDRR